MSFRRVRNFAFKELIELFVIARDDDDLQIERGGAQDAVEVYDVGDAHAAGHEEHGGHFRLEVHFGEELRLVFLVEEDVVYRDAVGVDMLFRNAETAQVVHHVFTCDDVGIDIRGNPRLVHAIIRHEADERAGDAAVLL